MVRSIASKRIVLVILLSVLVVASGCTGGGGDNPREASNINSDVEGGEATDELDRRENITEVLCRIARLRGDEDF